MQTIFILSLVFAMNISAAFSAPQEKKEKANVEKPKAGFGVSVVQTQPEFPGGMDSLVTFVQKKMTYPTQSQRAGAQGRLYVGFLIDKEGKLKDPRLLTSINDELDAEAIKIVNQMPDWKPATIGGSAVDAQYIIPIDFVLPKKTENN